jgi:peptidoglycan/xylan/chitin deacetylase (PgdA/CDA1 family)
VLAYHSVPSEERALFAQQMDVLGRVATAIRADVQAPPEKGGRYAVITFDDGLESVFDNALPELRKRGIHATLFIVPEVLGGYPNWEYFDTPDPSTDKVMSVQQLQEIPTDLVTIGSHSMTHPVLPKVDDARLRKELLGSRETLEKMLNREIKLFSFPYGACDQRVIERCREARYDRVFSALPVLAFTQPQEFLTGRVGVCPTDWPIEFRLKLAGAYRWLPYAYDLKRKIRSVISPRASQGAALKTEEKRVA